MNIARSLSPLIILGIILGIPAAFSVSCGADFPQPQDVEVVRNIIDASFRGQYAVAESLAISLQSRYPYHAVGYVMHAVILQSKMMDGEHFDFEDDFYMLIKLAERKCKKMLEDNPGYAWALYCLGLAHGSRAVYDSRAGSWWSAVRYGIRSKGAFARCIEADSMFYDAYVGLGSYHYWRSAKTSALNWLPFVSDQRERGLRELRMAAEKSLFSADFARNSLIWIWIDMRKYEEAESLSVKMQNKYPEGREFLWGIAYARLKQDDFLGAETVLSELVTRIEADSNNNNYNIVECRYQLAKLYLKTERYAKCLEQCGLVRETDLERRVRNRLKKRLSEIEGMERQARQMLKRAGQGP